MFNAKRLLILLLLGTAIVTLFSYWQTAVNSTLNKHGDDAQIEAAIDAITSHFTDQEAQWFALTGFEQGPKDAQFSWTDYDKIHYVTNQERKQAKAIITAICKGDFSSLQNTVNEFEGKPFSLAKVSCVLNHCLAAVDCSYNIEFFGERLFIGPGELGDDDVFMLGLSTHELPFVLKQVIQVTKDADGKENSQWNTDETTLVRAEGVLVFIGNEIVTSVYFHSQTQR